MPPNEKCPACGENVPDWHREWHTRQDQTKIFQGAAGMECPLCGAVVMHAQWLTPLARPATGSEMERVKRDVALAAYWALACAGKILEEYLRTTEGLPYRLMWTAAEVQKADQYVASNPLGP